MPDLKTELAKITTNAMADKPTRSRSQPVRNTVFPVNVARLVELVGTRKAAEQLGYSMSGLNTAIGQRNEISKAAEIAAGLIIEKMQKDSAKDPEPAPEQIILMRVPGDKVDAIMSVAQAMGIKASQV